MKFTTLIPRMWNDGRPVDPNLHQSLIDSIHRQFGGMTIDGDVTGYWTDDDGTKYVNKSSKVSIECERSRLQEAIGLVKRIGRRLKQKAMYFEVSGYDGVQFLRMKDGERKR